MDNKPHNIADKFCSGKTVLSVEFFPPKTEEGARQILRTANSIKALSPDYVSITYGAGGSTRERTLDYGELLKEIFAFDVMPHLTCTGHSKDEIASILERFAAKGFCNVMALRGDPPKGSTDFTPHPDGFLHASDLIAFIKKKHPDFSIGCAGYPEKHPEASSILKDIENLKIKTESGADFIVSQMFFDNDKFFAFCDKCASFGIDKPIIAGILPPLSFEQLSNFASMCNTSIPSKLADALKAAKTPEDAVKVGADWAQTQVEGLLKAKVAGIHLYILNRSPSALQVMRAVKSK